jgi:hypothetical protein
MVQFKSTLLGLKVFYEESEGKFKSPKKEVWVADRAP